MSAKRIAILATDGFEQSELMEPRRRLKDAGFDVEVVSPKAGGIRGWQHKEWGDTVPVDVRLSEASPDDYDALVLPGGQMNPDSLRLEPAVVTDGPLITSRKPDDIPQFTDAVVRALQ
jgi:protease I